MDTTDNRTAAPSGKCGTKETARIVGVSEQFVRQLDDDLQPEVIDGRRVYQRAIVEAFAQRRREAIAQRQQAALDRRPAEVAELVVRGLKHLKRAARTAADDQLRARIERAIALVAGA